MQKPTKKLRAITASKHNLRRRGNSFCKIFGRQVFSFLQKQQTLVSLNKHFGRRCFKPQTVPACKPLAAILDKNVMKIAKTNNRPLYILALVILIATFINAFFSTFNLLNLEIIPEIRYFSAVVLCPGLVIFCVIKIYKTESYFNKNWKKAMRIITYLIWILTAIIFNLFNFLGLIWTSPTYSTTYKNSHYYLYVDNGWDRQENDIKLSKRKYIFESTRLHAQRFNELIEDESAYLKIIKEYGDSHENEAQKRKRLDSLDNIANKMADEMRHN